MQSNNFQFSNVGWTRQTFLVSFPIVTLSSERKNKNTVTLGVEAWIENLWINYRCLLTGHMHWDKSRIDIGKQKWGSPDFVPLLHHFQPFILQSSNRFVYPFLSLTNWGLMLVLSDCGLHSITHPSFFLTSHLILHSPGQRRLV